MLKDQMERFYEIEGVTELPPDMEIELLIDKMRDDPEFDLKAQVWKGTTGEELLEVLQATGNQLEDLEWQRFELTEKVEKLEKVLRRDFGVHPNEVY